MRRRAILHVGTEKTGTTAIQNRLRAHAPQLARQGVLFPEVLAQATTRIRWLRAWMPTCGTG